jgi:urea transporter
VHRTETSPVAGAERRGVLALLRALADSGLDLAGNTVRMAAAEGRIVLHRVATRLAFLLGSVLVAAAGFLLLLVGAALALIRLAGVNDWLAFLAVGAIALAAGTALAARALRRLSGPDLAFPATVAELRSDIEALRRPPGGNGDGAP